MYGLPDRSSRPRRLRCPTPEQQIDAVVALRRRAGPVLGSPVTPASAAPLSAVSCVVSSSTAFVIWNPCRCIRATSMRLRATCSIWTSRSLDASPAGSSAPPVCERDRVRGGGFEYVHVAIDDHSRIAAAAVPSNEQADSAVAALQAAALAWYAGLGIHCKTVLTDNGPYYRSRQFA